MAWEDRVQNVLGHCVNVFKTGAELTHCPIDAPIQVFNGIWSDTYLAVDVDTGLQVMSSDPNIGVRLSDFINRPRKNDIIKRGEIEYRVRILEPDGQGGGTIVLEKIKVS